MELLVATAMFVTAVGLLAGATSTSLTARSALKRVENVDAALNTALGVVSTIDWAVLLDGRFNLPNLCPDEPLYAGFDGTSCTTIGDVTYRLDWDFTVLTDLGNDTSIAPHAGDSAQLTVSTARPDGSTARRSTIITAPDKGFAVDDYGQALGSVSVMLSGAIDTFTGPLLLLGGNDLNTVVDMAAVNDGAAMLRGSASACTLTTPCRIGLGTGPERGFNTDHALDATTVVGVDGDIVLDAGTLLHRTGEVRRRTAFDLSVQAVDDVTGRRLHDTGSDPAPQPGSVCVWLVFHDGHQPQQHPYCNLDHNGRTIAVDTYVPDSTTPQVRLPIPTGVDIVVHADSPDGDCPVVDGQTFALASTWSRVGTVGVCSSWTWGRPSRLILDGGDYDVDVDAFQLPNTATTVAQLMWEGDRGRPAAGVDGRTDPVWAKPRSATFCPGWPVRCQPAWLSTPTVTSPETGSTPSWTALAAQGIGDHTVNGVASVGDWRLLLGGHLHHTSPGNLVFTPTDSNPVDIAYTTTDTGFVAFVDEGVWQWAVALGAGSTVTSIAAIDSDSALVVGSYDTSMVISTAQGPVTLTPVGERDAFVAVIDTTGTWQWVRSIGDSGDDVITGVALIAPDTAVVTGHFTADMTVPTTPATTLINRDTEVDLEDRGDVFIAAIDTTGTWQWAATMGGQRRDVATAVSAAADGGGYVGGTFHSTATVATVGQATSLTSVGGDDGFLARFDSAGTWQWAVSAGSPSDDAVHTVTTDSSGRAVVAGGFAASMTIPTAPTATVLTSAGGRDAFVAAVAGDGTWQWAVRGGGPGDDAVQATTATDTGVTVAGRYQQSATFSTVEGVVQLGTDGDTNLFAAALDSVGNWRWATRALIGVGGVAVGSGLATDPSGGVTVAGDHRSTVTFPTISGGTSVNGPGVFLARIGNDGLWSLPDATTSCIPVDSSCLSPRPSAPYLATITVDGNDRMWPWTVPTALSASSDFTTVIDDVENHDTFVTVTAVSPGGTLSRCTPGCSPVAVGTIIGPLTSPATLSWRWTADGVAPANAAVMSLQVRDDSGAGSRNETIGFPTAEGPWIADPFPWRGAHTSTRTVATQLWTTSGQPAVGAAPVWSAPPTGSTLATPTPVTNSDGWATIDWQITGSGPRTGSVAVRATAAGPVATAPFDIEPRPAAVSVITGSVFQGRTSTATVRVRDAAGEPLSGWPVHLRAHWPNSTVYGIGLSPRGCLTADDGSCSVTVDAATNATVGSWRVTAVVGGVEGSDDAEVLISPARILSGSLSVRAGGSDDLVFTVLDGRGDPVDGLEVDVVFPPGSGLSTVPDTAVTVDGEATFRMDATPTATVGVVNAEVTAGELSSTVDIDVLPAPSLLQVDQSTVTVARGGITDVYVDVLSSNLDPVGGVTVLTSGGVDGLRVTSRTVTVGSGADIGRARLTVAADGDARLGVYTVTVTVASLAPITLTVQVV